ncbi:hypothetical protein OSTOST_17767, partial [Ostertagia ostertagi]
YESKLRDVLKLRHAGDLQYVEEQDLTGIVRGPLIHSVGLITLCKELGHGEFGSVWQASWKGGPNGAESMQVAVKCVAPDKLMTSSTAFL